MNVNDLERAGSLLLGATMLVFGLRRVSFVRAPAALGGAMLLHRALTGRCPAYTMLRLTSVPANDVGMQERRGRARFALPRPAGPPEPLQLQQALTINRSPEELSRLWEQPETVSVVLGDFGDVRAAAGANELEWTLQAPLGRTVQFRTRSVDGASPQRLAWESLPDSAVQMKGSLQFRRAPGDWGTIATLRMDLQPPGGGAGEVLAKLLGSVPQKLLQKALRRFKSLAETGEVPSLRNNPAARRGGRDE